MVKRSMTDDQIKADILDRLVNAGMWGKGHQDVDQLKKWMSNKLKKNGKRVDKLINELNSDGIIGTKNNGKSIYANPRERHSIKDFINEHYVLDWNKYLKEKDEAEEK